jgi:hypothetical protein
VTIRPKFENIVIVQNISIAEDATVVTDPPSTEAPISVNAYRVRLNRVFWSDSQ